MAFLFCGTAPVPAHICELPSPYHDSKSARAPVFLDASKLDQREKPRIPTVVSIDCGSIPVEVSLDFSAKSSFSRIYVEEGRRPGQLSFHFRNPGDVFVSLRDASTDGDFNGFIEETRLERKRYPLANLSYALGEPRITGTINWGKAVHGVQEWFVVIEFDDTYGRADVSVFRNDGFLPGQIVSSFCLRLWGSCKNGPVNRVYVPPGHQPGESSFHIESLSQAFISYEAAPGVNGLLDCFLEHSHLERRRYHLSDVVFDPETQTLEGCIHWGREVDGREDWRILLALGDGAKEAKLMMFKGTSLEDRLDLVLWGNSDASRPESRMRLMIV